MKRILTMVLLLVIMTAQISFADVATEMFNLIVVQNADSGPGPVTTAQLTINFEDEDGISLSIPSITTHNVGEVVTVNPPAVTGYTPITGPANITMLAGGSTHTIVYRANAIPPGPTPTAKLTINYVDENGVVLQPQTSVTHNVGSIVNVVPPTIAGYTPITGPANITILAGGSTHTIVYKANATPPGPTPTANLTINYVDENGAVIKPQTSVTHNVGSIINIIPPTIVGYTAQTPATNITVLAGGSTHTIVYRANAVSPPAKVTLTIRYKDSEGNMLSSEEISSVDKDVTIKVTPKEISGYTAPAPKTVTPSGNMVVDFVYNKIPEPPHVTEVKVTIKYEDEYGNKLLADKIFNVTKSTSIYVEAPAVSGYKALSDNLYYTIGELDLTIVVKYKSNPAPVSPGGGGGGASPVKPQPPVVEPSKPVVVDNDVEQPLMTGYPDGTFKPDVVITRAEAASIVYNLINSDRKDITPVSFSDVKVDDWFYSTVSFVTSEEFPVFVGYPDGSFRPNEVITRAEMATIVTKLREGNIDANISVESVFNDISKHWAKRYISRATELGIVESTSGSFQPDVKASRAETASYFVNAFKKEVVNPDTPTFVDVPKDHWAYTKIETIIRKSLRD